MLANNYLDTSIQSGVDVTGEALFKLKVKTLKCKSIGYPSGIVAINYITWAVYIE